MSLIIILPLVAQAWATPQIAYAAVDTETSAPAGESDKSTSPAGDSSAAESSATDGKSTDENNETSSNLIGSSRSSETNLMDEKDNASDSTIKSELYFTGNVDKDTTFEAGQRPLIMLKITNSGSNQPFTGGMVVVKLSKTQFVEPVVNDFTAGQDYMINDSAEIDKTSDPNNYLIKYQLKTLASGGSYAELPFYVSLLRGQDVGSKPTITETLYKSTAGTEIISQNQVYMPYTAVIVKNFGDTSLTIDDTNWNGTTLSKNQDMDAAKIADFNYMYGGEDMGSANSPFFVKITLPTDRVTFDAAKSPAWTYNEKTGVATYQRNGKIYNSTPPKLIVHPILSTNIQENEGLPFKVEAGFNNDNPKNFVSGSGNFIFKKRQPSYYSIIKAKFLQKVQNSAPYYDVNKLNITKDQVSTDKDTAFYAQLRPLEFGDFKTGDVATLRKISIKPDLEDGSLHLTSLRFYDENDSLSEFVKSELQNNKITIVNQSGDKKL